MKTFLAFALCAAVLVLGGPVARAQDVTLASADFTLALALADGTALDPTGLAGYLTRARCACPAGLLVGVAMTTDGAAKLTSDDNLEATIMAGAACDDPSATGCTTIGSPLTLNKSQTSSSESLSTTALFGSVLGSAGCATLTSTSTRLWAIVRDNDLLIASQPSLSIGFGGSPPLAPTAVKVLTADSGLAVSWTPAGDTTTLRGFQVLCMPGPDNPQAPAFEICDAAPPVTGTGPFASLDPSFICSGLLGSTSTRVGGLKNGTTYQIAVIAIGIDGTPSAPSDVVQETPGPTLGFDDIYKQAGGTAQTGCSVAGQSAPGAGRSAAGGLVAALLLVATLFRTTGRRAGRRAGRPRRRSGGRWAGWGGAVAIAVGVGSLLALPAGARASDDDEDHGAHGFSPGLTFEPAPQRRPSPHAWNLELRFGPYRPDVDSEFADRGQPDRPYEQVFSSSRHLMSGLELDRQVVNRGGTWSIGFGYAFYEVSAASLAADHVTRTGDQTSLRVMPFSLMAVYRADSLRERTGFPLVPYAKLGLDCAFWSISDTSRSDTMDGQTWGWHAAVGVTLDLSFLDPEGARMMDIETGVNQFALFFEGARYRLDGFGSSSALHVGDTTWFAGMMLEL